MTTNDIVSVKPAFDIPAVKILAFCKYTEVRVIEVTPCILGGGILDDPHKVTIVIFFNDTVLREIFRGDWYACTIRLA